MRGFSEASKVFRLQGAAGMSRSIIDRLLHTTVALSGPVCETVSGARVLEIGGPSSKFRRAGLLPLYDQAGMVDNVNFSATTLWEHGLVDGEDFIYGGRTLGTQYLCEATCLKGIADSSYDVIVSSHTLEHLADPLRALREWLRVCKQGGHLVLVLPHRDGSFDRNRPLTALEHLLDDERRAVGEDDETHLQEVLTLHDLRRDPDAGTRWRFERTLAENARNRGMHHHVFGSALAVDAVAAGGWTPLAVEARRPYDIVVLALKRHPATPDPGPPVLRASPFQSDRNLLRGRSSDAS